MGKNIFVAMQFGDKKLKETNKTPANTEVSLMVRREGIAPRSRRQLRSQAGRPTRVPGRLRTKYPPDIFSPPVRFLAGRKPRKKPHQYVAFSVVRREGIEPPLLVPKTRALSVKLTARGVRVANMFTYS